MGARKLCSTAWTAATLISVALVGGSASADDSASDGAASPDAIHSSASAPNDDDTAGGGRAPAAARAPAASEADEEYSFKWLDPDKKIYVLQNRKYRKEDRAILSAMIGPGFSSAYRSTGMASLRGGYYFTEDWGVEFMYGLGFAKENATWDALKTRSSNARPVVREIKSAFGAMLSWSPWYAKINVFNTILHFDWYFNGGLGSVGTVLDDRTSISSARNNDINESRMGILYGTGMFFHVTQGFGFRVDLTGVAYSAPDGGTTGANTMFSEYFFGFGLGLKL